MSFAPCWGLYCLMLILGIYSDQCTLSYLVLSGRFIADTFSKRDRTAASAAFVSASRTMSMLCCTKCMQLTLIL